MSFNLDSGLLTIESDNFTSVSAGDTKSVKNVIVLNISGPAVPLKLFASSSNISISHWTETVFISSFKGTLKGLKNRGPWNVSLKTGNLDIQEHQGALVAKCFRGNQRITKSSGTFHLHINEGSLKIIQTSGDLNFITNKAKIKLTKFKGNLKGFSHSGEIRGVVQAKEVDLSSKEGSLRMSFIGQAPRIRAYTERGRIYAPRYLHKKFSGTSTEVSGRIKGPVKKQGAVSLTSDTGNIYLH